MLFGRRGHVESSGTHLMSDEYTASLNAGKDYRHSVIHHASKFIEANVHVNNIELLARAGQADAARQRTTTMAKK